MANTNLETMTRSDMECEILCNEELEKQFDQTRLYSNGYSDDEMRDVIREWIIAGDECAAA